MPGAGRSGDQRALDAAVDQSQVFHAFADYMRDDEVISLGDESIDYEE